MSYIRIIPVEFNHCDPAGIVFYPRYFEMTNSVVENFFADVLDYPFSRITLEEGRGVPTVRIDVDFRAPTRLGEKLWFTLSVTRVGGASLGLRIEAEGGGITRLTADLVLVWTSPEGRAERWPDNLRQKLNDFMERNAA